MTAPLIVVGAGGFGRHVLDVAEAMNSRAERPTWEVVGILDDNPSSQNLDRLNARGVKYLGAIADFTAQSREYRYAVGVNTPNVRQHIAAEMDRLGLIAATLIHPDTTLASNTELNPGTVICAGARLASNLKLGRHLHINMNATIGHDVTIGDFVNINPLASVSGECVIGNGVTVGAGSVLLNGLRVGNDALVGAAACVTRDVFPAQVVTGVPAR